MSRRSVLVLGACGFLGARISDYLTRRAWVVSGIDRAIPRSVSQEGRASHLVCVLPNPQLRAFIDSRRPEAIVFAAGTNSVAASIENPALDFQNSVDVLLSVLEAVRTLGAETKVLFLSSAAVYGNQVRLPIREGAMLGPVSPYGYHKLISERLLEEYRHCFGVRTCVLRIFSAYGPGLRRQLLWDVCRKAVSEKEVVLDGTGIETRDFIHCDDIALAVEAVIERAPFQAEKYNLASGAETTVGDVASRLVRALEMQRPVRFTSRHRTGDPLRWWADITSIRRLGFQPKVSLAEGLAGFAKWAMAQKELLD